MLKLLIFLACFFVFCSEAIADGMLFSEEVSIAESQIRNMESEEALLRLRDYKQTIDQESYKTTLMLCEGYRRAAGMGPHPYHGRWMYSEADAGLAWGKVIKEGSMHSFSSINGLKADYIQVANLGLFDFDSWFNSMYSMFLIQSDGFLRGAMHCLDSVKADDINKLAAAIVIADQEATLAVELGITFTGGKAIAVLGKVIKNSRWYTGFGRFFKATIPTRARAPIYYTTIGAAGVGLSAFVYKKLTSKFAIEANKDEIMEVLSSEYSMTLDAHHIVTAFDKLQAANEIEMRSENLTNEAKLFLYDDFSKYLAANIDVKTELRMLLDLHEYRRDNPNISLEEMPIHLLMIEIVFQQKQELETLK